MPQFESLYDSLFPRDPSQVDTKTRCQTITQRGNPCRRWAVPGSKVCVLHGGSIPAAKEQIERMLLALQETAIESLMEVFAVADDKVLMEAAFKLLDRTGHGPQSSIRVEEPLDLTNASDDEIEMQTLKVLDAIRAKKQSSVTDNGFNGNGNGSGTTH